LGHWKNYQDLEENLSMPELIQTLKSMSKTESEKRIFLASLQGVDIRDENEGNDGPTFEDIRRRALGINVDKDDVLSLQGEFAEETGFGIGLGLGYSKG
jgi:hypothetical protein